MKITLELNPVRAATEAFQKARATLKRKAHEKRRDALLTRAKMNIFQWNTGIIRPTAPDGFRIQVGQSFNDGWEDCVGISIRYDNDPPGTWRYAAFSPARARLIAERLLMMADHLEDVEPSSMDIDKDEEPKAVAA